MSRLLWFLLVGSSLLAGCNPTLNWREVRVGNAGLRALLPCKPDHGSRQLTLADQAVELQMVGCEAGGTLFAVAHVDLGDAGKATTAQAQWQAAMLANMQATAPQQTPYSLKGATASPSPVRLSAQGRRADGSAVAAQGVWFAQGKHLYHAVIYADKVGSDAAEPFFSGFEFQ
jgi:hypothetical protein